jgi:hypothetical protein
VTPNEATIFGGLAGGLLGAVASVFTTRYLLKHGPNYAARIAEVNATLDGRIGEVSSSLSARIADVNTSIGELTQAHTDHFAQQASFQKAEVARQNASLWKPDARIDVTTDATTLTNSLVLKSSEAFTLLSVSVQSKTGATLANVPIDGGQRTTGYRIPISHENILKVKQNENLGGLQNGAMGQLMYRVERPDRTYEFTVPFTTEDVMVNNTICIKLLG